MSVGVARCSETLRANKKPYDFLKYLKSERPINHKSLRKILSLVILTILVFPPKRRAIVVGSLAQFRPFLRAKDIKNFQKGLKTL